MCLLCGNAEDTVQHRVYSCSSSVAIAARKDSHMPRWMIEWVKSEANNEFWATSLFCDFTEPVRQTVARAFWEPLDKLFQDCVLLSPTGNELRHSPCLDQCIVCPDGSAKQTNGTHAIATWAIAFLHESCGEHVATIRGPIWFPLPPTAQAAEHCAPMMCEHIVSQGPSCKIFQDALAVVKTAHLPVLAQHKASRMYAGVRRLSFTSSATTNHSEQHEYAHVKDHQSKECIEATECDLL